MNKFECSGTLCGLAVTGSKQTKAVVITNNDLAVSLNQHCTQTKPWSSLTQIEHSEEFQLGIIIN